MSNCEFLQSPLCVPQCLSRKRANKAEWILLGHSGQLFASQQYHTAQYPPHHPMSVALTQCHNTPQPHNSIPGQRIGEWILPSSFYDIQSNLLFLENCDKGKHWGACLKNKTDRRSQSTLVKSLDHFANDWAEGASLWVKRGVLPPQPFVCWPDLVHCLSHTCIALILFQ